MAKMEVNPYEPPRAALKKVRIASKCEHDSLAGLGFTKFSLIGGTGVIGIAASLWLLHTIAPDLLHSDYFSWAVGAASLLGGVAAASASLAAFHWLKEDLE